MQTTKQKDATNIELDLDAVTAKFNFGDLTLIANAASVTRGAKKTKFGDGTIDYAYKFADLSGKDVFITQYARPAIGRMMAELRLAMSKNSRKGAQTLEQVMTEGYGYDYIR